MGTAQQALVYVGTGVLLEHLALAFKADVGLEYAPGQLKLSSVVVGIGMTVAAQLACVAQPGGSIYCHAGRVL